MRSITSVLRCVPVVEQPALVRILCYELERHEELIQRLPHCEVDDGLRQALQWGRALKDMEFGSPKFGGVLHRLEGALDRHVEDEEAGLRALV